MSARSRIANSAMGLAMIAGAVACFEMAKRSSDPLSPAYLPQEVVLYSLIPAKRPRPMEIPAIVDEVIDGNPVLGKSVLADANDIRAVVAALRASVDERNVIVLDCFDPRHAVRLNFADRTVDYLICFQCGNYLRRTGDGPFVEGGRCGDAAHEILNCLLHRDRVKLHPLAWRSAGWGATSG